MANTGNSQQQINYGSAANDGQGDPLRTAFIKTDDNFDAIWATGPVGSNITIVNNTVQAMNTNGNLVLRPNGVGVIQANAAVIPNATDLRDLGSAGRRFRAAYVGTGGLSVTGDVTVTGNVTAGNISYTGNVFVGDLQGSVFADDSTIMVDAVDNSMFADSATFGQASIAGNVSANYFVGNGSLLTGIVSTYGNANVATLLAAFGSNTISTTGNISANYFIGNGALLTGITSSYGNANVVANLAALGTNPVVTTGNVSANYFLGNGSLLTGISASLPVANGTSNINIATANGNVTVTANAVTYTFGTDSRLTVPASNVVPGQISTQTTTQNEKGFDLSITAGNTDGCTQPGGDLYLSAGVGYNGVSHGAGNVYIVTGDRYGNLDGNIWNFGTDGALTFPLSGVSIRDTAGNAVAFGLNAGFSLQGIEAVAIGSLAGNNRQGDNAVAIGNTAGAGGSVSTNYVSGAVSPSTTLVVVSTTGIGPGMIITGTGFFGNITVVTVTNVTTLEISASAGFTPSGTLTFTGSQGDEAVAIGQSAGSTNQGSGAVAIGGLAGYNLQGDNSVAIGGLAGNNSQGTQAVAVGLFAGQEDQGQFSVALGGGAGQQTQGEESVAIGAGAGSYVQGNAAVAIGSGAGAANQRINSVAIGASAGAGTQGVYAVAIGASAGYTNQGNNSIILNATGANLDQITANTFTVAPVRNDVANIGEVVFYNATSKEITFGNTISVTGNITAGNISISGTGNVTGNLVGRVFTALQPAITTLGTLTNMATNGNANVAQTVNSTTVVATGNVSGGNISTAGNISGNTAGFAIGYRDIPQVSFTGNATLAAGDAGKHYYSTLATANTLTIANNTSVSWSVGTAITVVNRGSGNITVAQGSGVSLYLAGNSSAGNRTISTYGMATLLNVEANTWMINGTGVS